MLEPTPWCFRKNVSRWRLPPPALHVREAVPGQQVRGRRNFAGGCRRLAHGRQAESGDRGGGGVEEKIHRPKFSGQPKRTRNPPTFNATFSDTKICQRSMPSSVTTMKKTFRHLKGGKSALHRPPALLQSQKLRTAFEVRREERPSHACLGRS